ncbi:hypothetical protein [Winogradskya humida]|uniref:Uncharacterized protein n=1 Tax=Winogradskya humida TaxID=113566 RepID=A0ABQ4A784_9ACTN|nr:hypothetical protein [Actinoplanes humidus]GIE26716.1 hypothetical protein Ahu01nite_098180 [Actinoplanes humidus]
MGVEEAIALVAEEAWRQGFQVRQTRTAMWHFRKEDRNWFFTVRTAGDLVTAVAVLTEAGFDAAPLQGS